MNTQPNTLPALALPALTASTRITLASLWRKATRAVTTLFAGLGLMTASVAAHAAVVNAVFTNLGGGGGQHYSAALEIVNDGAPTTLSGFTLYLSEARYTNLTLTANPSTWDTLLIPPDLGIPAAGFLDAFAIDPLDALQTGQSQGGFNFTFDFIGQGLPGAMAFDINDANYNVLFSGVSTDTYVRTNQVPEPGAGWLVLIALGSLGLARSLRTKASQPATAYLPGGAA